jgi:hypothetical protein
MRRKRMMGKKRPLEKRESNDKMKRKKEKPAVPRNLNNFLANYCLIEMMACG